MLFPPDAGGPSAPDDTCFDVFETEVDLTSPRKSYRCLVSKPDQSHTPMILGRLLQGRDYLTRQGSLEVPVAAVAYDSRQVGPGALFVARRGLQTDGHRFIAEAIARGARAIVCETAPTLAADVTVIQVPDSREALAWLAARFYRHPSRELDLVGITGTNGKTTTSYLLEEIFRAAGAVVGVVGTVNARFGGQVREAAMTTPESLELQQLLREMQGHGVERVVLEVSSHALDLRRADCCRFAAGIFTNLSQDHLDYHQNFDAYYAAKKRLFSELLANGGAPEALAVINRDDPWGVKLLGEVRGRRLTYGFGSGSDIRPEVFELSRDGVRACLATPWGQVEVASPLVGRHNLYNILAAAGAALGLDTSPEDVARGLAQIAGVDGRLERVAAPGRPPVFVDYAHTPDALAQVLATLGSLGFRRLITVFGCGGDRDRTKRPLMGAAAGRGSDLVIITSDNPRTEEPLTIITQIEPGVREAGLPLLDAPEAREGARGYLMEPDRRSAIRLAVSLAGPDDAILLAGKGHENYQILGTRKIHFDDREEAWAALKETPAP